MARNSNRDAMLDIFEYTDYRKFLSDLYQARKSVNRAFSYRYIANKAGFGSPSFFGKILAGETNISHQTLMRLIDVFLMAGSEAEYFELLVNFDRSRTQSDKRHYFQRMQSLRRNSGRHSPLDSDAYPAQWFDSAVLSLIEMGLFHGDYAKLGMLVTPPITFQETRSAIDSLVARGMLEKIGDGSLQAVKEPSKKSPPPPPPPPADPPSVVAAFDTEDSQPESLVPPDIPDDTPDDLRRKITDLHDELKHLVRRAREESSHPTV